MQKIEHTHQHYPKVLKFSVIKFNLHALESYGVCLTDANQPLECDEFQRALIRPTGLESYPMMLVEDNLVEDNL